MWRGGPHPTTGNSSALSRAAADRRHSVAAPCLGAPLTQMTVGGVSGAKPVLRHPSSVVLGLPGSQAGHPRGGEGAALAKDACGAGVFMNESADRGRSLTAAGSALKVWRRKLARPRWLRSNARLACLGLLALAYHCAFLWLGRRMALPAGPAPPAAAGPERWDNGASCLDGDGALKPGWVCSPRLSLQRLEAPKPAAFLQNYYKPGVPAVLISLGVEQWAVFRDKAWSAEKLLRR